MSDTFVQNESIETLIHRYKSTIYGVALSYTSNRADADDIFQEVFRSWNKFPRCIFYDEIRQQSRGLFSGDAFYYCTCSII